MKGEKCKVTEVHSILHFSFFTSHFALLEQATPVADRSWIDWDSQVSRH
jgi:hypothetical protein